MDREQLLRTIIFVPDHDTKFAQDYLFDRGILWIGHVSRAYFPPAKGPCYLYVADAGYITWSAGEAWAEARIKEGKYKTIHNIHDLMVDPLVNQEELKKFTEEVSIKYG